MKTRKKAMVSVLMFTVFLSCAPVVFAKTDHPAEKTGVKGKSFTHKKGKHKKEDKGVVTPTASTTTPTS